MKAFFIFFLCALHLHAQLPATSYLDKNQVKAGICTANNKHWEAYTSEVPSYEVPKGTQRHAMFAGNLWIGGLDKNGQLHLGASTYRQNGWDFWPGLIDTAFVNANSGLNAPYNRLWKVDCNDIAAFSNAFSTGAVAANTYTVPQSILKYPAQGAGNFQRQLHPFKDVNNDGIYNPQTGGDYPLIMGHQQVLSIYNDLQGLHTESGSVPMGIEVHEHSFAFSDPNVHDSMQAINYTTFYLYTIYNRSSFNYQDVYITDWADVDVGNFTNDLIGTDTLNGFAYAYQGGSTDPTGMGRWGYGNHPPVLSHVILPNDCSSDGIDNDHDGSVDEAGEQFRMDRTTFYNDLDNTLPPQTFHPDIGVHYYNYMSGRWKDSSPFTYGGNAYGGSSPTNYVYTGNPQTNTGWTETSAGQVPGNRRFLMSSGPFNFPAGGKLEWGYAIVFSQDSVNAVNTISQFQSRVQRDVRNVKYYYLNHLGPQCTPTLGSGIQELAGNALTVMIYPNPTRGTTIIDLNRNPGPAGIKVTDLLGRLKKETWIESCYRAVLDLSALENGIYFIHITTSQGSAIQKLVKH